MVRHVIATPLVYKSYIWYSPEQATTSCHHVYGARDVLVQHMEAESPSAGDAVA
jgi:hypothetical protein